MSELRKSSALVLRGGASAAIEDEILNIGEVPGFDPAIGTTTNYKDDINHQDQLLSLHIAKVHKIANIDHVSSLIEEEYKRSRKPQ